ncbi:hypothetical protein [Sphingorhabdus sp.]|uniref:hypothetical protein n=1 Tax=Sphingorhabdus sp. TaxID=1902408 RepID=UPI00398312DA
MTNLTESIMVDPVEDENAGGRQILWMMLSTLGIMATIGAVIGYLAAHQAEGGGPLDTATIVTVTVLTAIIAALCLVIWRGRHRIKNSGFRETSRDKMNVRMTWGSGIFGGLIALALIAGDIMGANDGNIFGSGALPPTLAIILSVAIGIVLPAVTYYWHKRVIDEQEEAAYRTGALIAIYAFWFIAPVWWLLWRGGMLPAPDGVALYLMTTFVALIVWFWKKYS